MFSCMTNCINSIDYKILDRIYSSIAHVPICHVIGTRLCGFPITGIHLQCFVTGFLQYGYLCDVYVSYAVPLMASLSMFPIQF